MPNVTIEAGKRYSKAEEEGIIAAVHAAPLRESVAENWGIRGGLPASEVDLGFKVDL